MAARITWLILWPVLSAVAFFGLIVVRLTCGDDGPADYGEWEAIAFCRDTGLRERLDLIAFLPFAVLAIGAVFLTRPDRLRWLNRIAFATSGLVLAITLTQANVGGLAVLVGVIWGAVLITEAYLRHTLYGGAGTNGEASPGRPTSER